MNAIVERDVARVTYRTSVLSGTRSFTLLKLGRQLEFALCFRLLGRQQSLIIESRNSYARLRSFI